MPSEPQKKNEIHIDGNFTNSNIIIGDKNAVSSDFGSLEAQVFASPQTTH